MKITFVLNGESRVVECAAHESLLLLLRREGCFSVRYGSATGETGAAAVLLDGRLVLRRGAARGQADGHEVTTVE